MPEPISSTTAAAVTYAAAAASIPMLSLFGVPLGLQVDHLVAGFAGSLVAIILLNSVPATGDTWPHLLRNTVRRLLVALASSITAGYLTPLVALMQSLPGSIVLGVAFVCGGSAQQVFMWAINRVTPSDPPPVHPQANAGGQP